MQTYLNVPRVIPTGIAREVDVQPLRERWESPNTVRAVEECRRAGDQDVESRESTAVKVVNKLAQRFETPIAAVGARPLNCLDLV